MRKKLLVVVLAFTLIFGSFTIPAEASISAGVRKFLEKYGPAFLDFIGDMFGSGGKGAGSTKKWTAQPVFCPDDPYGNPVVKIMCEDGTGDCIPVPCKKVQGGR